MSSYQCYSSDDLFVSVLFTSNFNPDLMLISVLSNNKLAHDSSLSFYTNYKYYYL